MHVIAHRSQVTVDAVIHDQGFVATAEQMAKELVATVKTGSIRAQKPFHAGHQVGLWGFEHQMKMIGHQAISMHLPIGLLAAFSERLYPPVPIRVVFENRLPPISPVHHVIDRIRILHPQFARHAAYPCKGSGGESSQNSTIAGTDTFSSNNAETSETGQSRVKTQLMVT